MIISHKYRTSFIKTAKTAGTSIEMALSRSCGPDDIITPLWKQDEVAKQAMGGRGPQHYLAPFLRTDNRSYRDILDDEQREELATVFADEIEPFGYEF
jgi:hypothetical protein